MTSRLTTFAEATAVKQISSHEYLANFPRDWCIGTGTLLSRPLILSYPLRSLRDPLFLTPKCKVPHGGFVTSCFLQVAKAHFSTTLVSQNQPHTITLHLDFVRRTQVGPAHFTVKDVKVGARTSIIHIALSQDDREEVVGYITQSNMEKEEGVTFTTGWELDPAPLPVDLKALDKNQDKNWARAGNPPFPEFRMASLKSQFYYPRNGQQSMRTTDEWLRFANGDKWTDASVGYVADMWPMPVERFLTPGADPYDVNATKEARSKAPGMWYPTLSLNIDFKKPLPAGGVEWLFARVNTKKIKNGRLDIEVVITDETGDTVALSHHSALAIDASRNTAKRKPNKSKI